jgi:hypothetical protein
VAGLYIDDGIVELELGDMPGAPYGDPDTDRAFAPRAEGESMLMLSGELDARPLPVWIWGRLECELFPPPGVIFTPGPATGEEEPALPVLGTFIGGACGSRIP